MKLLGLTNITISIGSLDLRNYTIGATNEDQKANQDDNPVSGPPRHLEEISGAIVVVAIKPKEGWEDDANWGKAERRHQRNEIVEDGNGLRKNEGDYSEAENTSTIGLHNDILLGKQTFQVDKDVETGTQLTATQSSV